MVGRINYANPAFCKLVGLNEDELNNAMPPYPYWPPEEIKIKPIFKETLKGELSELGEQVIVMHNSSRRIITVCTLPFIDSYGKQTGWLTSVTDITEPTRYRNELPAQERFTVLQSLDTAVSKVAPSLWRFIICKRTYRKWFGDSLFDGHRRLAKKSKEGKSETNIIYIEINQKWFDTKLQKISGRWERR